MNQFGSVDGYFFGAFPHISWIEVVLGGLIASDALKFAELTET